MPLVAPAQSTGADRDEREAEGEAVQQREAWLASHGSSSAYIAALEQRMEEASAIEDQIAAARALAAAYADLIAQTEDDAQRETYEERSLDLIDRLPEARALGLRLDVAAAVYVRLRETAERWRFGMVDEERRTRTVDDLAALAERLALVEKLTSDRVEGLEREGARGTAAVLGEALQLARAERSRAAFLLGSARALGAQLADDAALADSSLEALGTILNPPDGPADPGDVRSGLMRVGYIAEAALAAALSEAIHGRDDRAIAWIDLLEDEPLAASHLGDALFIGRLDVLTRTGQWSKALALIDTRMEEGEGLSLREARFAAWAAMSRGDGLAADRTRLRNAGLASLIEQNQIAHVVDLAERPEASAGGEPGFVGDVLGGLIAYAEARQASEMGAIAAMRYTEAARRLEKVLNSAGVQRLGRSSGTLRAILGECLLRSAEGGGWSDAPWQILARAGEAFARAAEESAGNRSLVRERLWNAVSSYSDAAERAPKEQQIALEERYAELAAQFVEQFSGTADAERLLIRRASRTAVDREAAIERLLAVPANSPNHAPAQQQALRLIMQAYREAEEDDRAWAAGRFVRMARPTVAAALATDGSLDEETLDLARLVIEAMLAAEPVDTAGVLELIEAVEASGGPRVREEMWYRRAELAIAQDDMREASRWIEQLAEGTSRYAAAGKRLVFSEASQRLAERVGDGTSIAEVDASLASVAREAVAAGEQLTEEAVGESDADSELGDRIAAELAIAMGWLVRHDRERGLAERGVELISSLDDTRRKEHRIRRASGWLFEIAGEREKALDEWRALSSGLAVGSSGWAEARYHIIRLIGADDPARAISIAEAHVAVHGEAAMQPWGPMIAELASELRTRSGGGGG